MFSDSVLLVQYDSVSFGPFLQGNLLSSLRHAIPRFTVPRMPISTMIHASCYFTFYIVYYVPNCVFGLFGTYWDANLDRYTHPSYLSTGRIFLTCWGF